MKQKRGMEMAINTLILIILGVILLAGMVYVLEKQTKFFSRVLESFTGKTNIDSLVTSCNSLATQNALYEFCCVKKEVRINETREMTCEEIKSEIAKERITGVNCERVC